jgi:hypothetical protein
MTPTNDQITAGAAMSHELKTDPEVFAAVRAGAKTHEIRFNDRGFAVGDHLWLRETTRSGAEIKAGAPLEYTGRVAERIVSHIQTGYGLADGWCILSFASQPVAAPGATEQQRQAPAQADLRKALDVIADLSSDIDIGIVKTINNLANQAIAGKCPTCDGAGGWVTAEWTDPVSGPECEGERCEDCEGTGRAPSPVGGSAWHDAVLTECMRIEAAYHADDPVRTIKELIDWHANSSDVASTNKTLADNYLKLTCGSVGGSADLTDEDIERAALKHVATDWHLISHLIPSYRKTEQFERLKAFAHDLHASRSASSKEN